MFDLFMGNEDFISKEVLKKERKTWNFNVHSATISIHLLLPIFQGELGDYNTLVDKATMGHDMSSIELDCEEVRLANERAEMNLERLFEEGKKKESQVKNAESEYTQVSWISSIMAHCSPKNLSQSWPRQRTHPYEVL